ncbi:MAG: AAA family ATPase, partial [Ktedonobacteraceae bacterium]|nr:AAA family ATPase [Ktedonobacteraceae bacterium]
AADRERDVRLAFVDCLPDVTNVNQEVGFEYLDRFTKNVDRWVRHAVVRKLYYLADKFPQQVFRLLSITAQDKADWIRQESARSLARYFDVHTDKLISGTRLLIGQGTDFSTMKLVKYYSTNAIVRDIFDVLVDLCFDLNETNVEVRLGKATEAFEKARDQQYGEEIWQLYQELYRLHRMRTIHEISRYNFMIDQIHLGNIAYFEDTSKILVQLVFIVNILRTYQKREGLGDRLASLLEGITTIEQILTEVRGESPLLVEQKPIFSDRLILDLLLTKWRTIIKVELVRLRDKARIAPELQTKLIPREEQVGIWLCIRNEGNSPADHLRVELVAGEDFKIVGRSCVEFEEVSSRGEEVAEFVIKPDANSLHLKFSIVYGDAEARDKVLMFGDHLNLVEKSTVFKPIPNPYTSGTPVHDASMFYGREEDLEFLKENLSNVTGNIVIILYGQRRSGKTSLLYQLINTPILDPHIPIYIDMQNEAYKMSVASLLRSIAFSIHKELKKRKLEIERPGMKDFVEDPTFSFNLFLNDVEVLLGKRRLVILIDEFEVLEHEVTKQAMDPEIFGYLRSLMQHRRSINFLVAGTHRIEQLTAGYRSVFFNIARHYQLKNLSAKAATQLIVQPVQGFLEYDPFSVKKIRQLTADQPYLIHLVCRSLIEHCNLQQKCYVTINDINIALDRVIETGKAHFGWIWDQISLEERLVLSVVSQESQHEGGLVSLTEIEETYRHFGLVFNRKKVLQALQQLIDADVLVGGPDGTQFRVLMGLTRLWLQKNKSLGRVMLEENLLPE